MLLNGKDTDFSQHIFASVINEPSENVATDGYRISVHIEIIERHRNVDAFRACNRLLSVRIKHKIGSCCIIATCQK
jgi:hypothetical protein